MVEQFTADIFHAFIVGSVAVIAGGMIYEGGKRYVKGGRSNQFKGKIEALPFFFATIMLGWILQYIDPVINSIVISFHSMTRMGIILFSTMVLFNYTVDNFNYDDRKSLFVYAIALFIASDPYVHYYDLYSIFFQ